MHGFGDVRFFDRFARAYDFVMPSARRAPLREGLALAERDVERVVDLGGGTGRAVRALDVDRPLVVDASRGMLRRAVAHGLDAAQADAATLPLRDGTVDAVIVVDALHHVPDRQAALAEAARALADGGVLVVRDFDPGTLLGRLLVSSERVMGMDSTFDGPDALARLVADAGLDAAVLDRGFGYTVAGVKRGSQ
ncbi:class I SAM-dependent methyltransferase [Haloplanus sp. GCM10025708]|uniref:class I SAM-dependent methyltransferase n=1 Tax=Haloferacaceae TaxID=1644056 RepID=UPI00361B1625